ncbi:MAG: NAD-dependent deacylase [Thermoleophilia bacterium]|nr:NAD-dependent deacylase [Thermoleophilia bacterium]
MDRAGVERLAALLLERQPAVALTGAGISTESGIPDFRSPGGLWAKFDPLEYGSIDAFRDDPEKVWRFYAPRFAVLTEAQPNEGHHALAELERRGLLRAVVTQNIDLLHARAGSAEVVEVHGSIATSSCPRCGLRHTLGQVLPMVADGVPRCTACAAVLKPDVVFFGEPLPPAAMARTSALAREARLLLVVGSSLEVYPVAGLPFATLAAGGTLAIVNRGPTPADDDAEVRIDGAAGSVLAAVLDEVERRSARPLRHGSA